MRDMLSDENVKDSSLYYDSVRDRHNTLDPPEDKHAYRKIVNAQLSLAPSSAESLETYLTRIQIYEQIAREKNWNTHVDNPYKTWHQHKNPMGCFMCQDTQFIHVLIQVLQVINEQYPKLQFK